MAPNGLYHLEENVMNIRSDAVIDVKNRECHAYVQMGCFEQIVNVPL